MTKKSANWIIESGTGRSSDGDGIVLPWIPSFSKFCKPALRDRPGDARQRLPHRLLDDHPRVAGRELHAARRERRRRRRARRPARCTSSCLPEVVRAIRRAFGDDIAPGDAFITNHPYDGGRAALDGHGRRHAGLPRRRARSRSAAASRTRATSAASSREPATASARELFQEGIQYPPVRLVARRRVVRDVEAILRANSRTPDLVLGDIRGQIGVARLGERRLAEMIARYGIDAVLESVRREARRHRAAHARRARDLARRRARGRGVRRHRRHPSSTGAIRYHVRVEKRGDRIHFDFSDPTIKRTGPVNIRPPLARGCVYYALIAMIDPALPEQRRASRASSRRRSATARCSIRTSRRRATPTWRRRSRSPKRRSHALSGFVPSEAPRRQRRLSAGRRSPGRGPTGRAFVQYELVGSAYGGIARADGPPGSTCCSPTRRTAPIEILESEFPTRVRRFELIRDSGGAGPLPRRARAAPRVRDPHRRRAAGRCAAAVTTAPAFGVDGGRPGTARPRVVNPGTPGEARCRAASAACA